METAANAAIPDDTSRTRTWATVTLCEAPSVKVGENIWVFSVTFTKLGAAVTAAEDGENAAEKGSARYGLSST